MINGKTYYEILDLPKYGINDQGERVSLDKINQRERELRYMTNLDGQLPYNIRQAREAQVREAYYVLSNYELRKEYDEKLKNREFDNLGVDEHPLVGEEPEVAPKEPEVTPKESEVTPKEPKVAPKEPDVAPEEPEVTPKESEVTPKEPKVAPKEPDVAPQKPNNIFDKETLEKDAAIKAANRKRIINNSLIIGGSTLFFGPIGTIASIAILKKKGKLKLQKLASKGKIKEIKTAESELISEENKNLEEKIDELLNSPLKDNQSRYKLEIAKLRYEHQVNLLEKRIEFKKEQKSELGGKSYNRLYVLALEMRYAAAIKALEIRKKKAEAKLNVLNSYNPNKDRNDRLTKIQSEINSTNKDLQNTELSDFKKNQKLAKINRLNTKKIQEIDKMSLKKNGISRNQVVLAIFNSAKNKIANLFSNEEELETTKTR